MLWTNHFSTLSFASTQHFFVCEKQHRKQNDAAQQPHSFPFGSTMTTVKKTAQILRELNEELEEEKRKRFKAERYDMCSRREWLSRNGFLILFLTCPAPLMSTNSGKKKYEEEVKELSALTDKLNDDFRATYNELKQLRKDKGNAHRF